MDGSAKFLVAGGVIILILGAFILGLSSSSTTSNTQSAPSNNTLSPSFEQKASCNKYLDAFKSKSEAQMNERNSLINAGAIADNFFVDYSPQLQSCIVGYTETDAGSDGRWKVYNLYNLLTNAKIDVTSYSLDHKELDGNLSIADLVDRMNKEVSDLTGGDLTKVFAAF